MSATEPDSTAPGPRGGATVRRSLVEQEIYSHATRLFAERGFAGTKFQDIADAVGLTRPALYHYVSSKDDLLARLIAEIIEDSAATIDAITRRTDFDSSTKLREIVASLARRQGDHAVRFRLIIRSEADLPDPVAAVYAESRRAVLRSLATAIERGVADGSFRAVDARVAALGILGMVNWVSWWFNPDGNDSLDAICTQFADTALAGLLDPSGGRAIEGPHDAIKAIRSNLDRLEKTLRS
ncbi:TetR/AcrR family transcriptional regulator [Rhodococcus sp. IEGM 1307]|uniref:TetR/AcrR family transcriptional regulator n=1 Tax=Rhodococcus sp. IEGM 1307 TaxID=3047091 RepID=UPI0024B867D3|nr:TetR/AcrR family transcriptional regulator [Rhodococcus sp. IEGM 1307]MDI9978936.1 TetR/AcrR family transcriptional regulator [Rhodococcus sp. IEGM 1307]